jgi:hypothetical protein
VVLAIHVVVFRRREPCSNSGCSRSGRQDLKGITPRHGSPHKNGWRWSARACR